jgi:ribonuclease VapC
VDTSAIVAIVLGESGAEDLREALARSADSRISAPSYVELCAVLQRRNRPEIGRMVDRLLAAYGIEIEALDAGQARVAAQAYRDYGRRSGHRARLNLGDCFSYALASVTGEPLLYHGDDFAHTDIPPGRRSAHRSSDGRCDEGQPDARQHTAMPRRG